MKRIQISATLLFFVVVVLFFACTKKTTLNPAAPDPTATPYVYTWPTSTPWLTSTPWSTSTPLSTSTSTVTPGGPTMTVTNTPWPTPTYTSTTVPVPDSYEDDDSYTTAKTISVNGSVQIHNAHDSCDDDWVKFTATNGVQYTIDTYDLGTNSDTKLYLYTSSNTTSYLDYDDDGGYEYLSSKIVFTATYTGIYYIKQSMFSCSSHYGANSEYTLRVTSP